MSEDLIEDLKEFLNDANLSTYEINTFIMLLTASKSNPPTAREISQESGVPSGRIYEVLGDLESKGLVEIIEARPKKFKALSLNKALDNLISFHSNENKRRVDYLYDRAKILESILYNSDFSLGKEASKIFWSTSYGTKSILALYAKYISSAKNEIIFNEFFNETTLKIIPHGHLVYNSLKEAVDRGVEVKDLWSFEFDARPLTEELKQKCHQSFEQLQNLLATLYGFTPKLPNFRIKYIYHRMPSNFDIFDKKRIIFKLKNPLKPYQIFSVMNVVDLGLAEDLRGKFLSMWNFESIELTFY